MAHVKRFFLAALFIIAANAATVAYTGTFAGDDDVQLLTFSLPAGNAVTVETWSFAGGVNAVGNLIPAGGFSPDLWLFDGSGMLLQADSPESQDHAAPADCGPRAVDPATGFCWDGYLEATLPAGSYTLALTQDGNVLSNGYSLADGFTEEGVANYTDVLGLGGEFYLPDGVTERDGHWALDISGLPVSTAPEPGTYIVGLALLGLVAYRRR